MRAPVPPAALDRAVPALAALTVLAFAAGSSSIPAVKDVGLDARWLVLAALVAASAGWAPALGRVPFPVLVASAAFLALALFSALWSLEPRLSVGRAASVGLLFAAAVLIAAGTREVEARGARVLLGLLAGAVAVAVLGVLVLAVSYETAVTAASVEAPPRFQGFGENPNTVPLLLAVALPIALVAAWRAPTTVARTAAAAAVVLFTATVIGSGSRGALLAAAAGAAVTLGLLVRGVRRLVLAGAGLAALVAAAAALPTLPREAGDGGAPGTAQAPGPAQRLDVEAAYPLDADVGRPLPGGGEPTVERSVLGTSGRRAAWRGALEQVAERPLAGFGFGTEPKVFVDRYYGFVGGVPENSYIGLFLQLGLVGLLAFAGLVAVLVASGRVGGRAGPWSAAALGVLAAGLAAGVAQSYLYSVGNIATATFWIAAFLLPALAAPRRGRFTA